MPLRLSICWVRALRGAPAAVNELLIASMRQPGIIVTKQTKQT